MNDKRKFRAPFGPTKESLPKMSRDYDADALLAAADDAFQAGLARFHAGEADENHYLRVLLDDSNPVTRK